VATDQKAAAAKARTSTMLTTAISIRRDHWELLREVAFARARETGGRASVSAVIADLIESNKAKLSRGKGQ
jgi:hypothetical protein